jgi:hypothetical protein
MRVGSPAPWPDSTYLPSGENATVFVSSFFASRLTTDPLATSKTSMKPSLPPAAMRRPSGDTAITSRCVVFDLKVASSAPVVKSQTRAVPSPRHVASRRSSGKNATPLVPWAPVLYRAGSSRDRTRDIVDRSQTSKLW